MAEGPAAVLVAISNARESELEVMELAILERRRELGVGLSGAEARPHADGWLQMEIGRTGAPTVRKASAIPTGTSTPTRVAEEALLRQDKRPGGGAGKQARGGGGHDAKAGLVAAVPGKPASRSIRGQEMLEPSL